MYNTVKGSDKKRTPPKAILLSTVLIASLATFSFFYILAQNFPESNMLSKDYIYLVFFILLALSTFPPLALISKWQDILSRFTINMVFFIFTISLLSTTIFFDFIMAVTTTIIYCIIISFLLNRLKIGYTGDNGPKSRAYSRKLIMLYLGIFLLFTGVILVASVFKPNIYYIIPLAFFAVEMFILAWLLARIISAPTPHAWLYQNIEQCCGEKERSLNRIFDRLRPLTPDSAASIFCLQMFVIPSTLIKRINEIIAPCSRFYQIDTEFEIDTSFFKHDHRVIFPAHIQDKRELTNELRISNEKGETLSRLNDDDLCRYLAKALATLVNMIDAENHSSKELIQLQKLTYDFIYHTFSSPTDNHLSSANEAKIGLLKLCNSNTDVEEVLTRLATLYKSVKPVCIEIFIPGSRGKSFSSTTKLHTVQKIPLIFIKGTAADKYTDIGRHLQRFLTKKRNSYYFSLANADKAKSYHLTFSGPKDTYYAESEIILVDVNYKGRNAKAERMTMSCRCDQSTSRLYIKNGDGFHNVALSFSYENRSHRSLQATAISLAICLALIGFTAFGFVFNSNLSTDDGKHIQIIAVFFTVMTFAGLVSTWDALNGQHSEEWIWVSAAVTVAASLLGFLDLIYLMITVDRQPYDLFFQTCYWGTLLVGTYCTFIFVLTMLFHKIKLHSAFLYRTPRTRSLNQEEDNMTSNKASEYYTDLVGGHWSDGWLIPLWFISNNQPASTKISSSTHINSSSVKK